MPEAENRIRDVERSNDELRVALILAGRELRKLNFGRRETPTLKLLRRTLREAREIRYQPKS